MELIVEAVAGTTIGKAILGDKAYRCVLGRSGIFGRKTEGDGATPVGRFPLRRFFYRADRGDKPATALPGKALAPSDGWCDDPSDPAYNREVTLPYAARHEELWRADGLYDLIVVIGHNDAPVVPGDGSAVFLHVANPQSEPTAGCVAFKKSDLVEILNRLGGNDSVLIRLL